MKIVHKLTKKYKLKLFYSLVYVFLLGNFIRFCFVWEPTLGMRNENDFNVTFTEDSFISIKFEGNGVASWEKSTVSKVSSSLENCKKTHEDKLETKSVIEHAKSRDTFRWRKRIGHMFQLIRGKKTGGVCHVGNKVEGGAVKVRKGWMRTLTKRKKKTME